MKKTVTTSITSVLTKIAGQKQIRNLLVKKADKLIFKGLVEKNTENLKVSQMKKYQFLSGLLYSFVRNLGRGYISKNELKKAIEVLVKNNISIFQDATKPTEKFKEKYGMRPPLFIVLSPTQKCNLHCIGCYASSTLKTAATLTYSMVEKIIDEVHDCWGRRFVTISGGEPFMYKSEGKTLLDIFEKYNDMLFLIYTNGTLITPEIAARLAKTGNATPAISVEGFEKETDQRRGKGTYAKILKAFSNLREVGLPFGISVTGTSKNVNLLLKDEFYDFYFEEQGATYMWQFQLMPMGRGKNAFDLMINPEKRVKLYRKWEEIIKKKKYCLADFWNSGVLCSGCIAYGRSDGGYIYVDWNGNITPCVFVPYYVDNIYDLYHNDKMLADALFSDFMVKGREWQRKYGLNNLRKPVNWLMPCSIRDNYEFFRESILSEEAKGEDETAQEVLEDKRYYDTLTNYDKELARLTTKIWQDEFLNTG